MIISKDILVRDWLKPINTTTTTLHTRTAQRTHILNAIPAYPPARFHRVHVPQKSLPTNVLRKL